MRAARVECGRAQGVVGDQGGGGLCGVGRAVGWGARRKRLAVRAARPPGPGPTSSTARSAAAPQLENSGIWRASRSWSRARAPTATASSSTRTSSTTTTAPAAESRDPGDPRAGEDSFSLPNGTYTYPTDPAYANNAADLVELRVKPLANATAFRITLNTLKDPSLVATTIAIGELPAAPRLPPRGQRDRAGGALPDRPRLSGGPACAPATRRRSRRRRRCRSTSGAARSRCSSPTAPGTRPSAGALGRRRRALEQGGRPVPRARDRRHRHPAGGAAGLSGPTAFFNVAFRYHEPWQHTFPPDTVFSNPAWWRDRQQGHALAADNLAPFHAEVDFAKLEAGVTDNMRGKPEGMPVTGPMNRILASHFETKQGADYSTACGSATDCQGELRGRLQPYAIYVPRKPVPPRRLRPDAAAPLARRQLQPVRRQPQPVAARRARARARS